MLTLALLALVFSRVAWQEMWDRLASGNPWWGVAAVVSVVAALVLGAVRWHILLQDAEVPLPPRQVARVYSIGAFVTAFLPTAVGGDIARPLLVTRENPGLVRSIVTVVLERAFALVALFALAWVGVALSMSLVTGLPLLMLTGSTLAGLVLALAAWVRPPWLRALLQRLTPTSVRAHAPEVKAVVRATGRHHGRLALIVASSIGFQVLVTMQLVFLGKAIGVALPFGLAAVILAMVTITLLIPISIGGFGLREGAYVALLAGAGISHTDAVLLSLLTVPVLLIATLPGAAALVAGGLRPVLEGEPK